MTCPSYYMFFEILSNKTRFKIIDALSSSEKSVGDICCIVKEEQSKVSHNLKKLSECNFISYRTEGKKRIYSLNKATVKPILRLVERHVEKYCRGACMKNAEKKSIS